jgi:hypothetical protein
MRIVRFGSRYREKPRLGGGEAGGSTLRGHRQTDESLGCAHARRGGDHSRALQSGRSTFYCGAFQV